MRAILLSKRNQKEEKEAHERQSKLIHHPPCPRQSHHHHSSSTPSSPATPTAGARRKIGVAVDLSDENAFAVRWAVDYYISPEDAVVLLHVLFCADWGLLPLKTQPPLEDPSSQSHQSH
ncbi:unnamed protein product [Arabis nemorensis]|uniref:UspA domain-containing protein n=1 Tax=Arabis nemorensis TaxID=586526 RepID=A0A565CJI9_9BRAS|nr:unnamed protein product [Arabis nemorensis]